MTGVDTVVYGGAPSGPLNRHGYREPGVGPGQKQYSHTMVAIRRRPTPHHTLSMPSAAFSTLPTTFP
eukprot:scaffold11996_cov73-Cyclotella_meneghiniana.AAC.3